MIPTVHRYSRCPQSQPQPHPPNLALQADSRGNGTLSCIFWTNRLACLDHYPCEGAHFFDAALKPPPKIPCSCLLPAFLSPALLTRRRYSMVLVADYCRYLQGTARGTWPLDRCIEGVVERSDCDMRLRLQPMIQMPTRLRVMGGKSGFGDCCQPQ